MAGIELTAPLFDRPHMADCGNSSESIVVRWSAEGYYSRTEFAPKLHDRPQVRICVRRLGHSEAIQGNERDLPGGPVPTESPEQ